MRASLLHTALFSAVLLLAACGGGSGTSQSPSAPTDDASGLPSDQRVADLRQSAGGDASELSNSGARRTCPGGRRLWRFLDRLRRPARHRSWCLRFAGLQFPRLRRSHRRILCGRRLFLPRAQTCADKRRCACALFAIHIGCRNSRRRAVVRGKRLQRAAGTRLLPCQCDRERGAGTRNQCHRDWRCCRAESAAGRGSRPDPVHRSLCQPGVQRCCYVVRTDGWSLCRRLGLRQRGAHVRFPGKSRSTSRSAMSSVSMVLRGCLSWTLGRTSRSRTAPSRPMRPAALFEAPFTARRARRSAEFSLIAGKPLPAPSARPERMRPTSSSSQLRSRLNHPCCQRPNMLR